MVKARPLILQTRLLLYLMVVKTFEDGSYLEYSKGSFDGWCVYMVDPSRHFRRPPRDTHYFDFLQKQSVVFGADKIYQDFISIYERTENNVSSHVLEYIDVMANSYGEMRLRFSQIYTILYMGMVAEERKAGTRLGKRIKRLGVHKLLVENKSVSESANFMRGMRWREIDRLCSERGF